MRMRLPIAIMSIALTYGCVVNEDFGRGPITLSSKSTANFETYKKLPRPMFFAISTDGNTSFGLYCKDLNCGAQGAAQTLAECEARSSGVPCKIFANNLSVVWDGPVTYSLGGTTFPQLTFPATPSGTKNYTRPIAIEWEGMLSLAAGSVTISEKGNAGSISAELPDKSGHCTGTFILNSPNNGTWSATCSNGKAATGKYEVIGKGQGSTGTGRDTDGKLVRWTLAAE